MSFKTHKDNSPDNTIKKIRSILSDLSIFLQESKWCSFTDNCYSVNIENMTLPGCFSNGKGISKHYALASAYAEFMERLQAGFLIRKDFGLMGENRFEYQDEIELTLSSYADDNKKIIENLVDIKVLETYKDIKITCFPSYDVFGNKIKFLPNFINAACNSNGLCAGNTTEEAICQGICEIFERYVVREIYFNNNFEFPTIPLSELKELEIYSIINEIIQKGFGLLIKDCTLDGKFPVVGVILINKNFYKYSFGSDPIFEVALQRCLTELFQGINDASLRQENKWNKFDFSSEQFINKKFLYEEDNKKFDYQRFFINREGELPNRIFASKKESINFKNGFQKTFKDHNDSLIFLLNIIRQNNYKIYIQDLSYLDFPSFRVFIPEISVIIKINYERFRVLYAEKDFIKHVLLRLKKSSPDEILKCAYLLEPLMNIPEDYYYCRSFTSKSLVEIIIDDSSHFKQFDHLVYLLGILFFRVGNYEKAFKYFNLYVNEEGHKLGNLDYYSAVLLYLKLKSSKYLDNEIISILINVFGESLTQRVSNSMTNPEECFKYFILPECGDCSVCSIKKECYYEKWNEINIKITERIHSNPVKQEDLSKIFNTIIPVDERDLN